MSLFHSILSQLQEKISKESSGNETVAKIISDILHTTVTSNQVTVKDGIVRVKAAPTIKMAIMLQQQKIIHILQSEGFSVKTIQ